MHLLCTNRGGGWRNLLFRWFSLLPGGLLIGNNGRGSRDSTQHHRRQSGYVHIPATHGHALAYARHKAPCLNP